MHRRPTSTSPPNVRRRHYRRSRRAVLAEPPTIQRNRAFTKLQGQYLAFIDLYTKLHGRPPAEADMQGYFKVTPPSVHRMIVALAKRGLVARVPGQSRSIKILVPRDQLPDLE